MTERIPQSTTLRVPLQAYLNTDGFSAATGKTIAITISKNGAGYGNPSGGATNATEIGNGSYYVDLTTTDTATLGPLFVRGTATTIDDVVAVFDVVAGLAQVTKTTSAIGRGTATTGGSTTSIPTSTFSPAGGVSDQFKGRVVLFDADTTTANLRGQATAITASTGAANPTFTVTAMTTAPASGDTFSVI